MFRRWAGASEIKGASPHQNHDIPREVSHSKTQEKNMLKKKMFPASGIFQQFYVFQKKTLGNNISTILFFRLKHEICGRVTINHIQILPQPPARMARGVTVFGLGICIEICACISDKIIKKSLNQNSVRYKTVL